jgi:hypothetical protein
MSFSKLPLRVVPALALSSIIAACSSKSGSGDGIPGTSSDPVVAAYCDAQRAHDGDCDQAQAPAQREKCLAKDGPCAAKTLRAEALDVFNACMTKFTCSASGPQKSCQCQKSDDACFAEAAKVAPASPQRDTYENACRRKIAECGKASDGGVKDDWCTTGDSGWELFADATYDALTPCFALDCTGVNGCLSDKRKALCGP